MSRQRLIWAKIRRSRSFAALDYMARDCFHGLIMAVDDQGRIFGEPAFVRAAVWPLDDISLDDVRSSLDQMVDQMMIHVYEQMDGQLVIQMVNWWKYQSRQWAGRSEFDPPEGWTDRIRFNGPDRKIIQENWDHPGGFDGETTISRPDGQPSQDQMDDHLPDQLKTGIRYKVRGERRIPSGSKSMEQPTNLPEWMELIKTEKNKPAALKRMIETLQPDLVEIPDFGYIGRTAKKVGGAGRLAGLIWETSSKNVQGDLMAYCLAMAKGQSKDEQPASFAAIKEFADEE